MTFRPCPPPDGGIFFADSPLSLTKSNRNLELAVFGSPKPFQKMGRRPRELDFAAGSVG